MSNLNPAQAALQTNSPFPQRTGSVFDRPIAADSLGERIKASFSASSAGASGILTDALLDATHGNTGGRTGASLQEQYPTLTTLKPDKIYSNETIKLLERRAERQAIINYQLGRLTPTGFVGNTTQFLSGLAGGFWGSTVGDPASGVLNVALWGIGKIPAVANALKNTALLSRFMAQQTGRLGAFYRGTAAGALENAALTPLYGYASNSLGQEYSLGDAAMDIGVGGVIQGLGGALFPGKSLAESMDSAKRVREQVTRDADNLDNFTGRPDDGNPPPPAGPPEQVDLSVPDTDEFAVNVEPTVDEPPLTTVQEPLETPVPVPDQPIEAASQLEQQVLYAPDVKSTFESVDKLLADTMDDVLDTHTALEATTPIEREVGNMAARTTESTVSALRQLADEFPELKRVVDFIDELSNNKAIREILNEVREASRGGDLTDLRASLLKAKSKLTNTIRGLTKKGAREDILSQEQRSASIDALEAEVAELDKVYKTQTGVDKNGNPIYRLNKELDGFADYNKKRGLLRTRKTRKGKAPTETKKSLPPAEAEAMQRALRYIDERLSEVEGLIDPARQQDTSVDIPDLDAVLQQGLDALSEASLESVMSSVDDPVKLAKRLKYALANGISKRLREIGEISDGFTKTLESLYAEKPSQAVLDRVQQMEALVQETPNRVAALETKVADIIKKADALKNILERSSEFMDESLIRLNKTIEETRPFIENVEELRGEFLKQALCFLGGANG